MPAEAGKLSYARIWRGPLRDGATLQHMRVSGIFRFLGNETQKMAEAVTGDLVALGLRSGWYIVIPIRDVRIRARFDLGPTLFACFLRRFATCLGNFVMSAALCLRQIRSLSIVARLSRGI